MKVLILNGSPHASGTTARAIKELQVTFESENVEVEIIHVGNQDIRGCIGCNQCYKLKKCVFDDLVNEIGDKLKEADGMILASPVYFASPNATLIALCDFLEKIYRLAI